MGGFDIFLESLEKEMNLAMLSCFTKAVGGISSYLLKNVVHELSSKIRKFIDEVMFHDNERLSKEYSK